MRYCCLPNTAVPRTRVDYPGRSPARENKITKQRGLRGWVPLMPRPGPERAYPNPEQQNPRNNNLGRARRRIVIYLSGVSNKTSKLVTRGSFVVGFQTPILHLSFLLVSMSYSKQKRQS